MEHRWLAACLAVLLLAGQAEGSERAQRAEVAENKAEALEQRVVEEGDEVLPSSSEAISRRGVQAVDPAGAAPLDDAITCLARAIYWEARGEDDTDMEAVANVVMNRLGHGGFPDTICGVVRQGGEQGYCQFSWWCDGRPDGAEEENAYAVAKEVSRKAINLELQDQTGGALYFHHRGVAPRWGAEYHRTGEIGEFVFYKPPGGSAR